jgi:hypothetical protein
MKSLLDLIKSLYGSKAIASTIGTKTNVIRLPSGKLQRYLSTDLNIEAASDAAAKNAYNEMKQLIPEVSKMNDAEKLIFEGNLRRLKNKLESSGLIEGENVTSNITAIESKIDQLKQAGKELEKITGEKATLTDVLKDIGSSQVSLSKMQDVGLVRATARQILINDIKAGKIKNITVEEAINMGEPLDPFRQIYGEDALERLDSLIPNLRGLKTEVEAEKLARSKFKFEPDEARPKGSYTKEEMDKILKEGETESKGLDYLMGVTPKKKTEVVDIKLAADKRKSVDDLIDEYNANQDRLLLTDDEGGTLITYPEYNRLKDRNDEIAKVLEEKGIKSTPEVETQPEGTVIPFRKKPTEPEGKANGGMVERENYAFGSLFKQLINQVKGVVSPVAQPTTSSTPEIPLTVAERYNKYLSQPSASNVDLGGGGLSDLFRKLISKVAVAVPQTASTNDQLYNLYRSGVDGKANGGRIGYGVGGLGAIGKFRKFLKQYNYKEKPNAFYDFGKDYKEDVYNIAEDMANKSFNKPLNELPEKVKAKILDSANEEYMNVLTTSSGSDTFATGGRVGFKAGSGKKIVNKLFEFAKRSEFEKLNLKHDKDIVKAADEIGANLDDPKMGAQQIAEVYADMKFGKDYYDLPQDQQLDLYGKAYNYLTDMGNFRRQARAVEKYNAGEKLEPFDQRIIDQINDRQQKEILTNFDTTERKPNSKGGLNYLMGI